jgi:hypothetical protein
MVYEEVSSKYNNNNNPTNLLYSSHPLLTFNMEKSLVAQQHIEVARFRLGTSGQTACKVVQLLIRGSFLLLLLNIKKCNHAS